MGNSASSLPYSIGKQVCLLDHGWALHEGQQKSDGKTVSVFVAKKPQLSKTPVARSAKAPHLTQLRPALHHFSYSRKLRHPHILTVHATLDTDNPSESSGASGAEYKNIPPNTAQTGDLIIVTEACMPLDAWLQENPPPELRAWGLEGACRALHFLHASANVAHGNLCPQALMVTRAGDVKLWNFSLTTPVTAAAGGLHADFVDYEAIITPLNYRSPERQAKAWDSLVGANNTTHAMDAYAMAVMIHHVYGGHIPGPLVKATQRLQTANVKMRPRLQPLLKCPVFDTPYQKIQLQLEEFAVQPVEAKIGFWNNLTPSLRAGLYPPALAQYKMFPLMTASLQTTCSSESIRTQDLYRREVLSMLVPLFFIAENYLDAADFSREMGPLITLLFTVNDRGIRGSLLKKAPVLIQHLNGHSLNVNVFEPMCSGFSDSSAALRELTLQATAVLVPHLTQPNLEKLSRYLVRLQADTEASIRQQTVVFFTKLAPHLSETSRHKLLLPAMIRGMKDAAAPCRLAALQATLTVKELFSPAGIASQVVPAISPCLVDASSQVRKEAFSAMEDLLFVLRRESERLSLLPEAGATTGTTAPVSGGVPMVTPAAAVTPVVAPAPSSSGGYFSSWMSSSTTPAAVPAPAAVTAATTSQASATATPTRNIPSTSATTAMGKMSLPSADDSQGWGDDDDDDADGWGDDDLPLGGGPPARPIGVSQRTAHPSGKLHVGSSKSSVSVAKPAVLKLSVEDDVSDGWDDF